MITKKAGCILVNLETKKIALVCRDGNYSFPKGHMEDAENIKQCAIRETIEETGHKCHLIKEDEISIIQYITPKGQDVENYFYLAADDGTTTEKINDEDREQTVWIDFEDVEKTLSHDNLIEMWGNIKEEIRVVIYN